MQNATDAFTRTEPHDLDLDASVLAVVGPVCDRLGLRHYLKGQHLHTVMLDMVSLDANGATEAERVAFGLALLDLARTLKVAHSDQRTVERMQLDADCADDHLRGIIKIEGESPVTLDAYASALEKSAQANIVAARDARRRARQIRTTRTVARERLNIGGAA